MRPLPYPRRITRPLIAAKAPLQGIFGPGLLPRIGVFIQSHPLCLTPHREGGDVTSVGISSNRPSLRWQHALAATSTYRK
jgi:hypothetical protein